MKTVPPLDRIAIRPLADDAEAEFCARMMELSDPWLSLGTGYRALFDLMRKTRGPIRGYPAGSRDSG
ncbi:MAG: hypothetical protein AABM64_15985 [Pseudomonadota bacterium]